MPNKLTPEEIAKWRNALAAYKKVREQGRIPFTQQQLAEVMGVSKSYVSKILKRERLGYLLNEPITKPHKQRYNQHTGYKPRPANTQQMVQHVLDQCEPNTGQSCWLWQGYVDTRGRAMTTLQGRSITAQRKLYLLLNKPRPAHTKRFKVVNQCGNQLCCNPAHLIAKKTGRH